MPNHWNSGIIGLLTHTTEKNKHLVIVEYGELGPGGFAGEADRMPVIKRGPLDPRSPSCAVAHIQDFGLRV